jgi:hypothetical protein
VAVNRILENKSGIEGKQKFDWQQAKEAFIDPQSWILVLYTFCSSYLTISIAGMSE